VTASNSGCSVVSGLPKFHWLLTSNFSCQFSTGRQLTPQSQVKVTLWPTVSWPVSPGVKPHLGPKTRFLLLSDSCGFVDVGRPLRREDGSVTVSGTWHLYLQVYLSAFYAVICQQSGSLFMHITYSFICNFGIYCHELSDRRRGLGLSTGFIGHFNQLLQQSISILQLPTLWAPFSLTISLTHSSTAGLVTRSGEYSMNLGI
jgi:hypothetical protein